MAGAVTSAHELSYLKEIGQTVAISSAVASLPAASARAPRIDLRSVVLISEQPVGPAQLTWRTIQKG